MDIDEFNTRLTRRLDKQARKWYPQVAVRAPKFGIDYRYGAQELPFHAASVGKLVPAALTMQLVQQRIISLGTPVSSVLDANTLRGLFMDEQVDEVTFEHLLTHTSGVNDYLDTVVKIAVVEPDRPWSPDSLLEHSREHQKPVGKPGEKFLYTDTGFIILGLALEALTGTDYSSLVHERVFEPLGMSRSFMPFRTKPATGDDTIAPMYLNNTRVDGVQALTLDWAGGGIAGTLDDYLMFIHALHTGSLVSAQAWSWMTKTRHKYRAGLYYGAGTMNVKFSGFAPWLRHWPRLVGHLGLTAAHLWHDPVHDAEIVINFGSFRAMPSSFNTLIAIIGMLRKFG